MSSINYFARVDIRLQGITSLIMHNRRELLPKPTDKAPTGRAKSTPTKEALEAHARKGLYVHPDGYLCVPARAVWWATVRAGRDFTATGANRDGMENKMRRTLFLQDEMFPLLDENGDPMAAPTYDKNGVLLTGGHRHIDVRHDPAVNKQKGAIWTYRAEVKPPWLIQAMFRYNLRATANNLNDLIESVVLGGVQNGIGAWRPEKSGIHGQYEVLRFVVNGQEFPLDTILDLATPKADAKKAATVKVA